MDKPIGHVLLEQSLDNGRLLMHIGIGALVPFALAYSLRGDVGRDMAVIGLGILLHQVLDGMYLHPDVWLWPMTGTLTEAPWDIPALCGSTSLADVNGSAYFRRYLEIELTSPTEWAFGIATVMMTLPAVLERRRPLAWAMRLAGALLVVAWAWVALPGGPPMDAASVTLAVVSLGGAYLLMMDYRNLDIEVQTQQSWSSPHVR